MAPVVQASRKVLIGDYNPADVWYYSGCGLPSRIVMVLLVLFLRLVDIPNSMGKQSCYIGV